MRTTLMTAALFSLVLTAGCAGCGENNGDFDMDGTDTSVSDMADAGTDMTEEDAGRDMTAGDTGTDSGADMADAGVDMGPLGPLAFGGFLPMSGPVEGGVEITVRGDGFGPTAGVQLDGTDVSDVTVVDRQTLTFTLPPGDAGPVDVTVVGEEDALTFGEPFEYRYFPGPSGGAIQDAVTVRVTSGSSAPLQDAFVMLGTDPNTPDQGFTDADGLIEFSGQTGPVTVVAAAVDHSSSMILDVDARQISMSLTQDDQMSMEAPPPTATVEGDVLDLDTLTQPQAGETLQARVLATQRFFANPAPGADNVADDTDPAYSITTRIGEQRVVAIGGLVDDGSGDFTPEKIGLSQRILPATDEMLEGLDIPLDIPLDQTLDVEFTDDPTVFGTDHAYEITPFVDLGYEGKFQLPTEFVATGTSIAIDGLPELAGPLDGAAYELRVNVVTSGGTRVGPFLRVEEITDTASPVQVTVAAQPDITMPDDGMWADTITWDLLGTGEPDFFSLVTLDSSSFNLDWSVTLPADARSVTFPQFPDLSGEPAARQVDPYPTGTFGISISSLIVPGFDYDAFGAPGLSSSDTVSASSGSTGAIR